MLTIWHNPRCRKSRETLALLENSGKEVTIRRYLDNPPSVDELTDMLNQLSFEDPRALMRKGEAIYKEKELKSVSNPALPPARGRKSAFLARITYKSPNTEISFHENERPKRLVKVNPSCLD